MNKEEILKLLDLIIGKTSPVGEYSEDQKRLESTGLKLQIINEWTSKLLEQAEDRLYDSRGSIAENTRLIIQEVKNISQKTTNKLKEIKSELQSRTQQTN